MTDNLCALCGIATNNDLTRKAIRHHYPCGYKSWNVEMVTARQEGLFAKRLGRSLAQQRAAADLTQEQVAERIGVEQETISRFERGATIPPLIRLVDLADLYSVPLDALVRAGSTRSLDQANDIAAWLEELSDEDREWVRNWVVDVCQKLSKRA